MFLITLVVLLLGERDQAKDFFESRWKGLDEADKVSSFIYQPNVGLVKTNGRCCGFDAEDRTNEPFCNPQPTTPPEDDFSRFDRTRYDTSW